MSVSTRHVVRWKRCPLMPISKRLILRRRISLHSTCVVIMQFPALIRDPRTPSTIKKNSGFPWQTIYWDLRMAGQCFPRNEGWPNGHSLLKLSIHCLRLEFTVSCLGWLSLHLSFQEPQRRSKWATEIGISSRLEILQSFSEYKSWLKKAAFTIEGITPKRSCGYNGFMIILDLCKDSCVWVTDSTLERSHKHSLTLVCGFVRQN